jgi:hypothetical protein
MEGLRKTKEMSVMTVGIGAENRTGNLLSTSQKPNPVGGGGATFSVSFTSHVP